MANYLSLELTPPTYPVSGVGLGGRSYHGARAEFTTTVALGAGDTVQAFDLPPRARIHGGYIRSEQLDSNGSPTVTVSLGIAGNTGLFFNNSTSVGRAAGVSADSAGFQPSARDYLTTAKTRVFFTFSTGAATGVVGAKLVAHLNYNVEEPA